MDEKLHKPIREAGYLTANANVWRYRSILRYFYTQHERLRHYLFPEEIWRFLRESPHFQAYTEEMLQQDLDQLVEWNNLVPRQETGRVSTIAEFKKKKFRYQLTPYTIEIERMVIGLEQLGEGFGGSLERSLFDRLLQSLLKLTGQPIESWDAEDVHRLWQDIYDDFRKLTENATDYLAHLHSEKIEEKMKAESFIIYKDAVTEYLRNFMAALQKTSFRIEALLEETGRDFVQRLAERLADYELSIPRLDERPTREALIAKAADQWHVLKTWFVGSETQDSDILYLQNATNETIRRLTRFAQRLGEAHNNLRSRRMDYLHLARWFAGMDDIEEAHELSACVFGVIHMRHFHMEQPKQTEAIDLEIWDHPAASVMLKPRVKAYREKQKPNAAIDRTAEKQEMMAAYLRQKEEEERQMAELIRGDRIELGALPVVHPHVRKTLLAWIAKCMSNAARTGKSETGLAFKLVMQSDRTVRLRAEDGDMELPDYVLKITEEIRSIS